MPSKLNYVINISNYFITAYLSPVAGKIRAVAEAAMMGRIRAVAEAAMMGRNHAVAEAMMGRIRAVIEAAVDEAPARRVHVADEAWMAGRVHVVVGRQGSYRADLVVEQDAPEACPKASRVLWAA